MRFGPVIFGIQKVLRLIGQLYSLAGNVDAGTGARILFVFRLRHQRLGKHHVGGGRLDIRVGVQRGHIRLGHQRRNFVGGVLTFGFRRVNCFARRLPTPDGAEIENGLGRIGPNIGDRVRSRDVGKVEIKRQLHGIRPERRQTADLAGFRQITAHVRQQRGSYLGGLGFGLAHHLLLFLDAIVAIRRNRQFHSALQTKRQRLAGRSRVLVRPPYERGQQQQNWQLRSVHHFSCPTALDTCPTPDTGASTTGARNAASKKFTRRLTVNSASAASRRCPWTTSQSLVPRRASATDPMAKCTREYSSSCGRSGNARSRALAKRMSSGTKCFAIMRGIRSLSAYKSPTSLRNNWPPRAGSFAARKAGVMNASITFFNSRGPSPASCSKTSNSCNLSSLAGMARRRNTSSRRASLESK